MEDKELLNIPEWKKAFLNMPREEPLEVGLEYMPPNEKGGKDGKV